LQHPLISLSPRPRLEGWFLPSLYPLISRETLNCFCMLTAFFIFVSIGLSCAFWFPIPPSESHFPSPSLIFFCDYAGGLFTIPGSAPLSRSGRTQCSIFLLPCTYPPPYPFFPPFLFDAGVKSVISSDARLRLRSISRFCIMLTDGPRPLIFSSGEFSFLFPLHIHCFIRVHGCEASAYYLAFALFPPHGFFL